MRYFRSERNAKDEEGPGPRTPPRPTSIKASLAFRFSRFDVRLFRGRSLPTKINSRIRLVLQVLAHIEASPAAGIAEICTAIGGCSRPTFFRLLRAAKDDFNVGIDAVRGRGYVVRDWGVLNSKAVLDLFQCAGRCPSASRILQANVADLASDKTDSAPARGERAEQGRISNGKKVAIRKKIQST
jgi:hypothetical protein